MSAYLPPADRQRPGPWSAVLGFVTLLAIAACGVGLWFGVPIAQQFPSKVAAPDTVLGLQRITDRPDVAPTAERGQREDEQAGTHYKVSAIYADAQRSQRVAVLAGDGFIRARESFLDQRLREVTQGADEVGEFAEVDAGELDGIAKCAYFRVKEWGTGRGVLCGWADHGSFGIVFLVPADDIEIAARKLLDVRFAVETR